MIRTISAALAALALAVCAPAAAQGDAPLRIVIAFPPGGPVDFVARLLADGLGKELSRPVIVENKPGGNGAISAQAVIQAAPDANFLYVPYKGAAPAITALLGGEVSGFFGDIPGLIGRGELKAP